MTLFPDLNFGVHLHAAPFQWEDKVKAAIDVGCRRIDSAMLGFGGCPFAKDDMVGNLPTELLLYWLKKEYHYSKLTVSGSITAMASDTYSYKVK